jgi:glutamate decarboxylase
MEPDTAYQIIHDEIMLDGNARLNLATFVGTWMDDHARRLYTEAFDKNIVDKDEYPKPPRSRSTAGG